jgi:peptide/nickel transport system substrate-binding protein
MRKTLLFFSVLVILALLAACGPATTPPPATPKPAPAPSPAPAPAPAPTPTPSPTPPAAPKFDLVSNNYSTATPKTGGIIKYVQISGPSGFDVHTLQSAWAGGLVVPIFNNLIQINPMYQDATTANIIGDLAKEWKISPDGTEITFYLHQGVKWHDGSPFTADDVVYSLQKMADPKRAARVAATFAAMESVTKVDDFTVKVKTKFPSPSFLLALCNGYAVIMSKKSETLDPKTPAFLVGTGPFKFKNYVPESLFEVERNPNYFKKDSAGRPLPYLDGIQIYIMKGMGAGADAFIAKQLDLINPMQVLYLQSDVDKVTRGAPDAKFIPVRANTPYMIYLNKTFKPFQDPKVLQAMGLIYSSEDQILARFGAPSFGQPNRGIFSRTWGNSEADVQKIMGWAGKTYDQRVAEAKELMKQSGFPDGFKIRMVYANVPGAHSEPSFIQYGDALKKYLNITYELKPYPSNAEAYKARDAGEWEMFNEILYISLPDPDGYMSYFKTGGASNFMKYSNPEVDKLFDQQTREFDAVKRRELTLQIEKLILQDKPVMPGAFLTGNLYYYPYIMNFGPTAMVYGPENKFEMTWFNK